MSNLEDEIKELKQSFDDCDFGGGETKRLFEIIEELQNEITRSENIKEVKDICDSCSCKKESTYSENLKEYMCEDCWDNYGELCHLGLA